MGVPETVTEFHCLTDQIASAPEAWILGALVGVVVDHDELAH